MITIVVVVVVVIIVVVVVVLLVVLHALSAGRVFNFCSSIMMSAILMVPCIYTSRPNVGDCETTKYRLKASLRNRFCGANRFLSGNLSKQALQQTSSVELSPPSLHCNLPEDRPMHASEHASQSFHHDIQLSGWSRCNSMQHSQQTNGGKSSGLKL